MSLSDEGQPVRIEAAGCRTGLGDGHATWEALLEGRRALSLEPVLGSDGGDLVPLATLPGRNREETAPANWLACLDGLVSEIPAGPWGTARYPVFVTSSNFGVGSLYAFHRSRDRRHLPQATPAGSVEALRRRFGWGTEVAIFSHACVSAHLGLIAAGRALWAGWAERALVFTFDFISPFVAGGFHALKILNGGMPAPYARRAVGSIGLGDGAAFAVLGRGRGEFTVAGHTLYNEMQHFTANDAAGAGFAACLAPLSAAVAGRRVWIKGHGTGTLDSGRLEAEAFARLLPEAPLVSWKGSFGHTLGSCGLVELAIALEAVRGGRTPGTIGSAAPCFSDPVAIAAFPNHDCEGVILASNAFGGAHAACLICHE
jgi:3-oxoacyl-(acyl-carrier-protein) synthase